MPNPILTSDADQGSSVVADPSGASRTTAPPGEGIRTPVVFYWHLISQAKWKLITATVLVTVVTMLVTARFEKQYSSTAVIRVDPTTSGATSNSNSSSAGTSDATLLTTTEAQVVVSPASVLAMIRKLHLDSDAYYRSKIGDVPANRYEEQLLALITKQISVSQPFNTELLEVRVTAHTPQLASDMANALAQAYINLEYEGRARAMNTSAQSMSEQQDKLRAQMERDQEALVRYEAQHDVINADDRKNIYTTRLEQINQSLGDAQAARIQAEANYRVGQQGSLDALMSLPSGAALVPLQRQLLEDQRQMSRLAAVDGPRHPRYVQQQELLQHDQQVLDEARQRVVGQLSQTYQGARVKELMFQNALESEKREVDDFNMRAIRYDALQAAAVSSRNLYYSMQQHMQDLAVAATLRGEDLRLVSAARPLAKPISPHPLLAGALGFVVSLLLGVGVVLAGGLLDRTLANPDQVEHWLHLPVVGMLPRVASAKAASLAPLLEVAGEPEEAGGEEESRRQSSNFHEAVTSLHNTLEFSLGGSTATISVVSALPAEGKSTVSANLAAVFARLSGPTVLVDADLRKANVHRIFNLSNRIGLSQVLRRKVPLEQALIPLGPRLSVLPAGPPVTNPAELLHLRLAEVIEQLQGRFATVVVDGPPVLGFADAAAVVGLAHATLLVISAGQTPRDLVTAAHRDLHRAHARVSGVVLNGVSSSINPYYSYYSKSYSSYYTAANDSE